MPVVGRCGDTRESTRPLPGGVINAPVHGRRVAAAVAAAAVILTSAATASPAVAGSAEQDPALPDSVFAARTAPAAASRGMLRTVLAMAVAPIQGPPVTGIAAGGTLKGWPAALKVRPVLEKQRVRVHKPVRRVEKSAVSRTYRVVRHAAGYLPRHAAGAGRYGAAVAYAYAQLGSRYVHGAAGDGSFDCSGLMMRAYRRAGLRLPHSSGGQAARAHPIRRSQARSGDLVVGAGHVGIYVGDGYMIDAGNPRVGVSKRRLYGGLRVERF